MVYLLSACRIVTLKPIMVTSVATINPATSLSYTEGSVDHVMVPTVSSTPRSTTVTLLNNGNTQVLVVS